MTDPSINDPQWDIELDDAPFRSRAMRIAAHAGAKELGAALFEIDPGEAVAPYHVHHGNEEMLLVLSGTPRLRTPDGVRTLQPGAIVAFPRGAEGAHRVSNGSEEPVRLLIFSTMKFPDVAEHLDTGTQLAIAGPGDARAFPAGSDIPPIESVVLAMQAAAEREQDGPPAG